MHVLVISKTMHMALAMLGIPIYIFYIIKYQNVIHGETTHICVILSVDIVVMDFIIAIFDGKGLLKTALAKCTKNINSCIKYQYNSYTLQNVPS